MAPDSAPPRFACEPFGRHFDLSGSCPLSYDVADIGTFTAPAVLIFAKRFNDLVGVPSIEYLVRWMQLAARPRSRA